MDSHLFAASPCGRVVRTRTGYEAYVPDALPPSIHWDSRTARALEATSLGVAALDTCLHENHERHLPLLLRADAAGAIRAEGFRVDIADLLRDEARQAFDQKGSRLAENYVLAYRQSRTRLEEFPLSLRLIRELHYLLLSNGGEVRTTPGQFRRTQNWIGPPGCTLSSAEFVPPPAHEMRDLLHNWEQYLHTRDDTPSLVRLALAYHQFIIIHPFLAMNDATLALLAPLLLQHLGVTSLSLPMFGRLMNARAATLQQRMLSVCMSGGWEEWLTWLLHGVADTALQTRMTIQRLQGLEYEWRLKLHAVQAPDTEEMHRVLDHLLQRGATTLESAAGATGLSSSEVEKAMRRLVSLDIAIEDRHEEGVCFWSPEIVAALNAPLVPYRSSDRPL